MSPLSKTIGYALALLLVLPAIAVVAAPPPPNVHIGTPTVTPTSPTSNDQVTVNVTVTANAGIQNVTVHYSTDNWKTTNNTVVASYNSTTNFAIAHIPPDYNGGNVTYYVQAYDTNGNLGTNNNHGNYFTYHVSGSSASATTSMWVEIGVVLVVVGVAASVGLYSLKSRHSTAKTTTR